MPVPRLSRDGRRTSARARLTRAARRWTSSSATATTACAAASRRSRPPAAGSTAPASPSSPGTRTATISGPLGVAPSTYLRTIRVSDGSVSDAKPLTVNVTQENADPVVYTGPAMQFTASTTTTTATVQLQATITDINDGSRGDIRNAVVHFMNMDTVPATELCQVAYPASAPKTFALINPADSTQATAGCPYTFSLGSADSNSWDIVIFVYI